MNRADFKLPVNSVKPHAGNTEPSRCNSHEGVETRHGASHKCTICGEEKPLSEFYVKDRATGRLDRTCKACRIIAQRERVLGISEAEYQSLYRRQAGRCGICRRRIYSRRFKRLAVDHCHTTGRVRGLLCSNCNTGLGLFKDDPNALNRAIEWVKV